MSQQFSLDGDGRGVRDGCHTHGEIEQGHQQGSVKFVPQSLFQPRKVVQTAPTIGRGKGSGATSGGRIIGSSSTTFRRPLLDQNAVFPTFLVGVPFRTTHLDDKVASDTRGQRLPAVGTTQQSPHGVVSRVVGNTMVMVVHLFFFLDYHHGLFQSGQGIQGRRTGGTTEGRHGIHVQGWRWTGGWPRRTSKDLLMVGGIVRCLLFLLLFLCGLLQGLLLFLPSGWIGLGSHFAFGILGVGRQDGDGGGFAGFGRSLMMMMMMFMLMTVLRHRPTGNRRRMHTTFRGGTGRHGFRINGSRVVVLVR